MNGKTLIVYATRTGINEEAAVEIADVLKTRSKLDVTIEDLKDGQPDIKEFQNIIVGAGVRGSSVYGEAVDFLAQNFEGKNVALFFCCEDNETPIAEDTEENAKKALAKNKSLKPIDVAAFGGCKLERGRPVLDDANLDSVRNWATDLGKKFDSGTPMAKEKKQTPELLKDVPPERVFRFFKGPHENTGVTASNTVEFSKKLQEVPIESVNFHFQRRDFQRWFKYTIEDAELATRIDKINIWTYDEELRDQLSKTVQNRITELMETT